MVCERYERVQKASAAKRVWVRVSSEEVLYIQLYTETRWAPAIKESRNSPARAPRLMQQAYNLYNMETSKQGEQQQDEIQSTLVGNSLCNFIGVQEAML
jgi:hypothetical protein